MTIWVDGRLQPGNLCPFCGGRGAHFYIKSDRYAWWTCAPCGGAGSAPVRPPEMRIGAAQGKFLRQYPESQS